MNTSELTLICKWGLDGSSGQSNYRQMINKKDDSSVFITSMVPLQVKENKSNIIWQNPTPSSTRFCRSIKFMFAKENKRLAFTETNEIQNKIANLKDYIHENKVKINFELVLTIVDGKVCQMLTDTKSTQC